MVVQSVGMGPLWSMLDMLLASASGVLRVNRRLFYSQANCNHEPNLIHK